MVAVFRTKGIKRGMALLTAAVMPAVVGCGAGFGTSTANSVSPSQASYSPQSVTNFGDSITCGYYASPNDGAGNVYSVEGYAGVFNAKLGKPSQNLCRAGDQAADMARLWVYPFSQPQLGAHQLYTAMVGTNDANICGASSGCLLNWSFSLEASLAWLAMPSVDKVLGSDMQVQSGTWTKYLNFGLGTSDPNATITFSVNQAVAGRPLNLAYRVGDCTTCNYSATVFVDGAPVDVLHTEVHTGHPLATQNGSTDTIFLDRVPLGASGKHTITVTTASAGGYVCIMWAGVPTANYAQVNGSPHVLIGKVPLTQSTTLNNTVATYNTLLQAMVQDLSADGLYITTVDTGASFDITHDLTDLVHPNNGGHAKIAAAFASNM